MKTQIPKLIACGLLLALLAGCIVLSVYPFYTPKDLIFDPGLSGRWNNTETGKTNEFWQFAASDGKFFMLSVTDEHDTNCFEAHLFQLKQYQFLDLLTTNRSEFEMPMHLITKVTRHEDNLSLEFLDFGWLAGLLQTNPAVLRHVVVPAEPGNTNDNLMVYLTADTKDLQKFLLKHVKDTNAFSSDAAVQLKRVSP
jgi:hypothetical protein